jgi:phage baseplate assembly protein W
MAISFPYRVDQLGRTAAPVGSNQHARELLEQLLFTAPGERVMRPTFGTGVRQMVFSPAGDQAAAAAQHLVSSAIQQWLSSWIELQSVEVETHEATLTLTVVYRLRSTGESQREQFRIE